MRANCRRCGGVGQVLVRNDFAIGLPTWIAAKCPECQGFGWWSPLQWGCFDYDDCDDGDRGSAEMR